MAFDSLFYEISSLSFTTFDIMTAKYICLKPRRYTETPRTNRFVPKSNLAPSAQLEYKKFPNLDRVMPG